MFKNTGYFNPTGTRNITFSDYDPINAYQRPDRFFLKYVRSYVPPPPLPPEPVVDNGGDNNIIPGDSYNDIPGLTSGDNSQVDIGVGADYTTASDLGYTNDPGIEMGPGGGSGSNSPTSGPTSGGVSPDMADAMNSSGTPTSGGVSPDMNDHSGWNDNPSNFGAHDSFAKGGTIPPMYANQGMAMPGLPEKGVPSNVGTISDQQRSSFDKGQIVGYTDKGYNMVMDTLENPAKAIEKGLVTTAITELAKNALNVTGTLPALTLSGIVSNIYDDMSKEAGLQYGENSEVDMSANNTSGYTSNPSQMDASSHPSFGNIKDALNTTSPEVDAAINDIAADMVGTPPDNPADYGALSPEDVGNMSSNTLGSNNTPSDPPSTMSDHANVHGDSPSPATPDMGTDFGDAYNSPDAPSVGSSLDSMDSYSGGHPGMGGGSNSSGNDGGMQGGADDPAGAGAGMGGPGDGTWSKGGRIYASQGGPVYAHEGTNLLGETRLTSPTQNYDSFKASDEQIKGFFDSQEYKDFEEQQKTAMNTMDMGSNSKYFSDYMGSSSKGAAQDRAFELYMKNSNQPIPTAGVKDYGLGPGSMFNTELNNRFNTGLNNGYSRKSNTMTPISGGK